MIALVEGAKRQKTPNEIALNILLAGLTIIFLLVVVTLQPFAIYSVRSPADGSYVLCLSLLVCLIPTTIGGLAFRHRHRRHGSHGPAQRARHVRTRGRSRGRRGYASSRQDRHHHAGQSAGSRVRSGAGSHRGELADAAQLSSLADETPEGRSIVVLAKEKVRPAGTRHWHA